MTTGAISGVTIGRPFGGLIGSSKGRDQGTGNYAKRREILEPRKMRFRSGTKKAPDDAGAFEVFKSRGDQYFATTAPPQLKR